MNTSGKSKVFVILFVVALLVSACGGAPFGNKAASAPTATPVIGPVAEANRIVAEGRLAPVQSIALSFLGGGRVKEVLVAEGSLVEAGQVVARLSGAEQLRTAIEAAEFELLAASQEIDALNETYAQALAEARLQMAQAKIELEDAQDDRTSMIYRRASDATLNGLRADLIMAEEELEKAQDYYDHVGGGKDELVKAQALSQLSAAQKARDRAEYNVIYASELPDQNEIDKADANLQVAMAKVETIRLRLERLSGGPDTNALALADARKQRAEAELNARLTDLENLELKAPFRGTIVDLNITAGEQISPGLPIATLADFSQWIVETTDLTEINIADVQVGQAVTLVADALPDEEFTGRVERISNLFQDRQGDVTYTARIVLDQGDERLRWGMTVMVDLPRVEQGSAAKPAGQQPPAAAPTIEVEATPAPEAAKPSAEDTVKAYFQAVESGDAQGAANLLSNYSIVSERTTREAAAEAIRSQSARWSDLAVVESKTQDDNTTLVHVTYASQEKDEKTGETVETKRDEWWPVRFENGKWLYNWNNVIDYRTVDVAAQSTAGLTINPIQITRYADRLSIVLFVQNRANETIFLGQSNEQMAVFHFGEKTVEAEKAQFVFERQKTYPEVRIDVKGLQESYPDRVEIRKWKDYQVAPWFDFNLSD